MKWPFSILVLLITLRAGAQQSEAVFARAEQLFANEKYRLAVPLYSEVIASDPENMNAYLRRGFCHSVLKEYNEAIADFSVVIQQHPEHPFAYISRGSAYNKLEDFQTAMTDFDRALNIDPKNQEAYNNRGWAKNGLQLYKDACKDWKTSRKLGNAEARLILKNNHCNKSHNQ